MEMLHFESKTTEDILKRRETITAETAVVGLEADTESVWSSHAEAN
jgi:hypothetical protein